MSWNNYGWRPYVSAAERRARAERAIKKLEKSGRTFAPVILASRKIATTVWGKAWCDHLESHSDYSNRMPRGRSYVRNGHVQDLQIEPGKVKGIVAGSQLYNIEVNIKTLPKAKWQEIRRACQGKIGSLIELLQGRFSDAVMGIIGHPEEGIFPKPAEIELNCSCPDWADMCKHVAAVLYAVGARLDTKPELLFILRNVDHNELISEIVAAAPAALASEASVTPALGDADVKDIFGIELDQTVPPPVPAAKKTAKMVKKDKKGKKQPKKIKKTAKNKKNAGKRKKTAEKAK